MLAADNTVKVIERSTRELLFECAFEKLEKAYAFASECEAMDIDVEVVTPTAASSLAYSLGLSEQQRENLSSSMREEIEEHDQGCCAQGPNQQKKDL